MKIDTFSADSVFLRPKTDSAAGAPQKGAGENFAALVEEAAKNAQGTANPFEAAAGKSELNSAAGFLSQSSLAQLQISRLKAAENASVTPEEAVKQVEETLSLLEDYAVALGDPGNTLKDRSPLAEELSFTAESLNTMSRGLKQDDPLKELSSETAALAAVEALKFKRGDFV